MTGAERFMRRFLPYNPNPKNKIVGDCTVRAISKAMNQDWETTYTGLCVQGFIMKDMPSANRVWGAYLRKHGFKRYAIPEECSDCYTVYDFAYDNPYGTYVLALDKHVVCVKNGTVFDSWESGNETPFFYWTRED